MERVAVACGVDDDHGTTLMMVTLLYDDDDDDDDFVPLGDSSQGQQ